MKITIRIPLTPGQNLADDADTAVEQLLEAFAANDGKLARAGKLVIDGRTVGEYEIDLKESQ